MIIDILSAKTKKLIWRGVGTRRIPSKLNAEKRKEIIDEIVNFILNEM